MQLGNGGRGFLLAYVTGAPLVGNALFAAGLWRPEFVTYAGLSAFYLGTLVMPWRFGYVDSKQGGGGRAGLGPRLPPSSNATP